MLIQRVKVGNIVAGVLRKFVITRGKNRRNAWMRKAWKTICIKMLTMVCCRIDLNGSRNRKKITSGRTQRFQIVTIRGFLLEVPRRSFVSLDFFLRNSNSFRMLLISYSELIEKWRGNYLCKILSEIREIFKKNTHTFWSTA